MKTRESLNKAKDQLTYMKGQRDMLRIECNKILKESETLTLEIDILEETNKYFVEALQNRIDEVRHKVEDIINRGLSYVYKADDVQLVISTTVKASKTQFVITLKDGDIESSKLRESFGGGLIAIIAFLFKVVINVIYKNERFMVFDESLNFVSRHYQEPLSQFIKKLCDEMDTTIVLITHQPLLADKADSIYEAYKAPDGSTKFKHIINEEGADSHDEELC